MIPPFGETRPVAPGVLWLRMPLPYALDHVNLWLIEDGEGWALVDTGVPDRRTRALWEAVLAGPMQGRPLTRLIVTHFHPDHIGLADWLGRRFGVMLETPLAEWLYGRMLALDGAEDYVESSLRFYSQAGFSGEMLEMVAGRGNAYGARIKHMPAHCQPIEAGQELVLGGQRWRVIIGRGHSPQMACLHCPALGLLITGDQILPLITPNVSIWPSEPEADQLALFLGSLDQFAAIPDETLLLPSHGAPFRGLCRRLAEIREHHMERLAETMAACSAAPISAYQLLGRLFPRQLDEHQLFFALGEALAHLHYLAGQGKLRRLDRDGVRLWQVV